MNYRIVLRGSPEGDLFYIQRNKFWKWVNLDIQGDPCKYPKYYKSFDQAHDNMIYFASPKYEIVILEHPEKTNK